MNLREEIYETDKYPIIKKICNDWRMAREITNWWDSDSLSKLEELLSTKLCRNLHSVLHYLVYEVMCDLDNECKNTSRYYNTRFTSIQSAFCKLASEKLESMFMAASISRAKEQFEIKEPPPPKFIYPNKSQKIPKCPGVYFLWDRSNIEYVGRAKSLKSRLNSCHHILKEGHGISWFELDKKEIISMEYLYIGLLKPKKNIVGSIR